MSYSNVILNVLKKHSNVLSNVLILVVVREELVVDCLYCEVSVTLVDENRNLDF